MLNLLHNWCHQMVCLLYKAAKLLTVYMWGSAIRVVDKYTYFGFIVNKNLDVNITAKCFAQSARRALGYLMQSVNLLVGCHTMCIKRCMISLLGQLSPTDHLLGEINSSHVLMLLKVDQFNAFLSWNWEIHTKQCFVW